MANYREKNAKIELNITFQELSLDGQKIPLGLQRMGCMAAADVLEFRQEIFLWMVYCTS